MARAIFGDFSPHIVKATQGPTPYSPLGGMERMLKSPVTNLAIAGISRAIKEGEADERQEALEVERQQQLSALQAQRKRAAEGALGIERQIGDLEAPRASLTMGQMDEVASGCA